jgi:hypothetical protein
MRVGALRGGEAVVWSKSSRRFNNTGDTMKKFFAAIMSMAVMATFTPLANAQSACPPEIAKAKEMLSQKSVAAPRSLAGARGQDPQAARSQDIAAPRSLAGARGQDPQAARGENPQAARGENPQAARGENPQAARGKETPQAARGENPQAARGENPQAARGENPQAARGKETPQAAGGENNPLAARGDVRTARAGSSAKPTGDMNKASGLIKEAEAACKAGDMKAAKEKAEAAIAALK